MRRYRSNVIWLTLVFSLSIICMGQSDADRTEPALRIDPETFTETPPEAISRGPQAGPRIDLRSPENNAVFRVNEPFALHLEFLPATDGVEPDMATLEVYVRKGLFGRDITEEVKPFIKDTAIRIPSVDFQGHAGNFRFSVRIRDQQGRSNAERFSVTVET